jgi:hypothetical protein
MHLFKRLIIAGLQEIRKNEWAYYTRVALAPVGKAPWETKV